MIIARSQPAAASRQRPRFLTRATFWICNVYLLSLVAIMLLIWQWGDVWWPATVLLFSPRWVIALPMLALLPLAMVCNRKSLITLTASTAMLIWPIMGLRLSRDQSADNRAPFLRVMTCNIHRHQLNADEFKSLVDQLRPDVIALQDWSSVHEAELFGGSTWRCRRDGELFLATRYPIIKVSSISLEEPPAPSWKIRPGQAMYYHLQTPLGPVSLINLHLASPHEGLQALREFESDAADQIQFNSHEREMESASILKFVDGLRGPLVILGDFNTPSESAVYSENWDGLLDAFDARGFGFGITHVSTASSVRIDHILLGSGWDVRQCWLGQAAGSPHRPLVADLQLTDADASPLAQINP